MARSRRRRIAQPGKITQADIARVAGVSIASVSRSLSHPELVSEALCAQVTAAAADLAYRGGGPKTDQRRCVGAVVARLDDGFTGAVVDALARELARSDVSLIAAVTDGTPEATQARVAELMARGAGAVAFCGAAIPALPEEQFPQARVPFVSLDGDSGLDMRWTSVFSRVQALALAVRYLGQLGHVKVALFDVPDSAMAASVKERSAPHGVEVVNLKAELGPVQAPREVPRWCMSQQPRITGLVCGSDRAAVAVLCSCAQSQIAVPGELALIGFGDSELSRHVRPALTSLRVAVAEAGVTLARRLTDALAGRASNSVPLAVKLVARASTAAEVRSGDA